MINKRWALGTYEIELMHDKERQFVFDKMLSFVDYVDTAINYNNDYILSNYITNAKIISKISACHYDNYDFFVDNHLKCLGREYIDIMLIHSNRGNWLPLAKKVISDKRFKCVGVSNFNVNDLKLYERNFGIFPKYNEIEINIDYVDIDTINFCKENNIDIIAYGILGGKYNAIRNISAYSLPHLITFVSKFANIIILKPESFRHVNEYVDIIFNYEEPNNDTLNFECVQRKAITPMIYLPSKIKREYFGVPTYHNACGKNVGNAFIQKTKLDIDLPVFEMRGDYLTYLRYIFRQTYCLNDTVYDFDFLIGDDKRYYTIYMFDDDHNLTKIRSNDIEVWAYDKGEYNEN